MMEGNSQLELAEEEKIASEEKKLESGLTVLFSPETELPPNCGFIYLYVKVGNVKEEKSQFDFSHLLEHILCRACILDEDFTDYNMNTIHVTKSDHTVFGFPVDNESKLSKAFEILSMMATKVEITDKLLRSEHEIITIENVGALEEAKVYSAIETMFCCNHDIQKEFLCATEMFQARLPEIKAEELEKFYKKWYKLENMCLIFVGNCQFQEILTKAEINFTRQAELQPLQVDTDGGEQVAVQKERIHRVNAIKDDKTEPAAYMIFKTCRPTLKVVEDLKPQWEAKTTINAFNSIPDENDITGQMINLTGQEIAYVFSCDEVKGTLVEKAVFDALLNEVRYWKKNNLPESRIKRAREKFVRKLEIKTSSYLNDVRLRCSFVHKKLRNKFMYGDALIHPKSELKMAHKWILSDARSSLKFIDGSKQYILSINLWIDKEEIRDKIKKSKKAMKPKLVYGPIVKFSDSLCNNRSIGGAGKQFDIGLGLVEWKLPNGMRVAYHRSKHLDKWSLFGFAYGGLSNSKNKYAHYYSCQIVDWLETSGFAKNIKDSKEVKCSHVIDQYMRYFQGTFRSSNFVTALKMVWLLFLTNELPDDDCKANELELLERFQSAIDHEIHDCSTEKLVLRNALEIARGFSTLPEKQCRQGILHEACKYFNACFKDPSQFTTIIVGDSDVNDVETLITKYLGSIPKKQCAYSFPDCRSKLKKIPINFPETKLRRTETTAELNMLTSSYIFVLMSLDPQNLAWDKMLITRLELMMNEGLRRHLRYTLCKVYDVTCEIAYDNGGHLLQNDDHAIMLFNFKSIHCEENDSNLVEEAIKFLETIRENGPAKLKVMKGHEDETMKMLVNLYDSATPDTDVEIIYQRHKEMEKKMMAMGIEEWRKVINRIFPDKFTEKHFALVIQPDNHSSGESDDPSSEDGKVVLEGGNFDEDLSDAEEAEVEMPCEKKRKRNPFH